MNDEHENAAAARHYSEAHATHYEERDLLGALRAYGQLIEQHPDTAEAGYSNSQIRNIVNLVVPAGDLLASQTGLAVEILQRARDGAAAGSP